jgi:hypothetical protein
MDRWLAYLEDHSLEFFAICCIVTLIMTVV